MGEVLVSRDVKDGAKGSVMVEITNLIAFQRINNLSISVERTVGDLNCFAKRDSLICVYRHRSHITVDVVLEQHGHI